MRELLAVDTRRLQIICSVEMTEVVVVFGMEHADKKNGVVEGNCG